MSEDSNPDEMLEEHQEQKFEIIYSCLRCGTTVSNTELARLPEIKCICGFRVFIKVRPPLVKSIKAI
jgi:DNA-directed RNA polymerase subunit P